MLHEKIKEGKIQRRDIRYHIFRLRDGVDFTSSPEFSDYLELKEIIQKQFIDEMNWENFTFDWDVSANDPLKVITQFEWDGRVDLSKRCDPPAFTKQKK